VRQLGGVQGFTLIEAMIVVVVAGLIMAIVLPGFHAMRQRTHLDTAAQQLVGDLRRAQVEAIKRNRSIKLTRTGASSYTIDSIGNRSFDDGITFGPTSMLSVRMAAFGPPVGGGATFIVRVGGRQKTVAVSAAGLVNVQ
jgi:prepilin-type N-terminal cleavage/methylation domain-containing protein